jgi:hypothetical protein
MVEALRGGHQLTVQVWSPPLAQPLEEGTVSVSENSAVVSS